MFYVVRYQTPRFSDYVCKQTQLTFLPPSLMPPRQRLPTYDIGDRTFGGTTDMHVRWRVGDYKIWSFRQFDVVTNDIVTITYDIEHTPSSHCRTCRDDIGC